MGNFYKLVVCFAIFFVFANIGRAGTLDQFDGLKIQKGLNTNGYFFSNVKVLASKEYEGKNGKIFYNLVISARDDKEEKYVLACIYGGGGMGDFWSLGGDPKRGFAIQSLDHEADKNDYNNFLITHVVYADNAWTSVGFKLLSQSEDTKDLASNQSNAIEGKESDKFDISKIRWDLMTKGFHFSHVKVLKWEKCEWEDKISEVAIILAHYDEARYVLAKVYKSDTNDQWDIDVEYDGRGTYMKIFEAHPNKNDFDGFMASYSIGNPMWANGVKLVDQFEDLSVLEND